MLTKKDFVSMARELAAIPTRKAREIAAGPILTICRASNPKFDESRFRKAAGL